MTAKFLSFVKLYLILLMHISVLIEYLFINKYMLQFGVLVKHGVGKLENHPGKSGWLFSYCNVIVYCNIIWGQASSALSPDVRSQQVYVSMLKSVGIVTEKKAPVSTSVAFVY